MNKNDKKLITAVLVIGVLAYILFSLRGEGKVVVISQNGEENGRFSLMSDECVGIIYEENEVNDIVIKNGKVWMRSATCPDQICVEQGEISEKGETIVCLPHKLVIEIK